MAEIGVVGLDHRKDQFHFGADRLVFAIGWTNLRMAGMGLVPRAHEDRKKIMGIPSSCSCCSGSTTTRENKDISMPWWAMMGHDVPWWHGFRPRLLQRVSLFFSLFTGHHTFYHTFLDRKVLERGLCGQMVWVPLGSHYRSYKNVNMVKSGDLFRSMSILRILTYNITSNIYIYIYINK